MKISMAHPNGDVFNYDLSNRDEAQDFISDIEFELTTGCAKWLAVFRHDLPDTAQNEIGDRLSRNLANGVETDK